MKKKAKTALWDAQTTELVHKLNEVKNRLATLIVDHDTKPARNTRDRHALRHEIAVLASVLRAKEHVS